MVTETATCDLVMDAPDEHDFCETGYWSEDAFSEPRPRVAAFPLSKVAGGAGLFALSSCATFGMDPWLRFDGRDSATTTAVSQSRSRKRIGIGQARRLALAVLAEAERERAEYAEEEARIAAIWEEAT